MVSRDVEDEVVALAGSGEILLRVIDDPVRADRPEHLELPGAVHGGHVCSVRLGELHGDGPHTSTRAVDQDLLSRLGPSLIAETLDRDGSGGEHCRGLFEREVDRLQLEPGFWNGRILGKGAAVAPEIGTDALTEDLIARVEPRHVPAHRLDEPRQIGTGNPVLRSAQPGSHDAKNVGHPSRGVPDVWMDGGRANPDQHFVILDVRLVDFSEF
jgi:hypothetical protein